jgi:hypothetical protein
MQRLTQFVLLLSLFFLLAACRAASPVLLEEPPTAVSETAVPVSTNTPAANPLAPGIQTQRQLTPRPPCRPKVRRRFPPATATA